MLPSNSAMINAKGNGWLVENVISCGLDIGYQAVKIQKGRANKKTVRETLLMHHTFYK
jgi:hypothetical protein